MQNKQTLPQLIDQLKAQGCKVRDEVPNNDFGDLYITPNGELKCARELWRIQGEQKQTYRILDVGEKLQEGDEVKTWQKDEWSPTVECVWGCEVLQEKSLFLPHGYYRRPILAETTAPKNWEQVAKAFENEVARQADYIEGLERDLRSESGWKDLLAIRDKRIEDLVELCHKESASAEEAWQKAERFEDCLNQVAVILGPKTTIHDDGFTDGEPTCHRVVEVLTERILRLWKLEAANDNANG